MNPSPSETELERRRLRPWHSEADAPGQAPFRGEIELVVTDVDGTLLDSGNRLGSAVARALGRARQAGLTVCLASGRSRLLLEPILQGLGLSTPFIASGGGYVADPTRGLVISDSPIPDKAARRVVAIARAHRLGLLFEEPQAVRLEADADTTRRILALSGGLMTPTADVLGSPGARPRKITLLGERETLQRARQDMDEQHLPLHVVFSTAAYLDITVAGCNKGTALLLLTRYLGVPLERTAVIGDGSNDLEMFGLAGLSVAMANAPSAVRSAADWVVPTNDESGVGWALHAILGDSAEGWE